jgi:Trk-type K+ transport system membrane component
MYSPWVIGINTRIVVITTFSLIIVGAVIFYIFEYNNTLAEHNEFGKIITAFFGSVTPRTAGFNTVNPAAMHFSTILVTIMLMWIGASPGSTGGGIKTSTFAIAVLNFISLAKGKDRIEVFRREISQISIRRAFATVALSIVVLGLSILFLTFFDREKGFLTLVFESFSAFGTVGLSLGITSQLTDAGKIVIIITMFIGRVSMLAILVAFLRKMVNLKYKYPAEEVLIT